MGDSTRSTGDPFTEALDAKAREAWEAGYRAAMRDHLGDPQTPAQSAEYVGAAAMAWDELGAERFA